MPDPNHPYVCAIVEIEPRKFEITRSSDVYHPDHIGLMIGLDDGKYATKPYVLIRGKADSAEQFRSSVETILNDIVSSQASLDSIMESLSADKYATEKVDLSFLETLYAMSTFGGTSHNVNSLWGNFDCKSDQTSLEEVLHPRARYSKLELAQEKRFVYNRVGIKYDPPGSSFVKEWGEVATKADLPYIKLEGTTVGGASFSAELRYATPLIQTRHIPSAIEYTSRPTVRLFEVLSEKFATQQQTHS